jgi:hypothetical protein
VQACFTDLSREDVRFNPLPDRDFGSGCVVTGAVQLLDIGVPVTNLKSMRCPLARTFTGWVRFAVAPGGEADIRQRAGQDRELRHLFVPRRSSAGRGGGRRCPSTAWAMPSMSAGFVSGRRAQDHRRDRLEVR